VGNQQVAQAMNALGIGGQSGEAFTSQANTVEGQNISAFQNLFKGVQDALAFA